MGSTLRLIATWEGKGVAPPPLYIQTLSSVAWRLCIGHALRHDWLPYVLIFLVFATQNDCCNNGSAAKCKVCVVKWFFTAQQYPATIRKFKFCMDQRKWVKNVYSFGLVQLKVAEQTWRVQKRQILTTDGWALLSSTSI